MDQAEPPLEYAAITFAPSERLYVFSIGRLSSKIHMVNFSKFCRLSHKFCLEKISDMLEWCLSLFLVGVLQ